MGVRGRSHDVESGVEVFCGKGEISLWFLGPSELSVADVSG